MRNLCTLLLVCFGTFLHAQKGVVPYRIGSLWGFADTLGKIIQTPKYDRIYFPAEASAMSIHNLPQDCYVVEKGGLRGLFNTSEMIAPAFDRFYFDDFQCIGIKKNDQREYFQTNGMPLFNTKVEIVKDLGAHYLEAGFFLYFIISNPDKTRSLVAFSPKKPGKPIVLAKQIESVKVVDNSDLQASFLVEFSGKPYEEKLTFDVDASTGSITPSNPKRLKQSNSYGYDLEGGMLRQEGEYDDVAVPPMEMDAYPNERHVKEIVYCSYTYKNDTLQFHETLLNKRTGGKSQNKITTIQLPAGSTQVKVNHYLATNYQNAGDSLRQFRNYVQFKHNNKTGILCFNQLPPMLFDTLEKFINDRQNTGFFLVGNRNQDGEMRYGIVSDSGKFTVPMEYERLTYNRKLLQGASNVNSHSSLWLEVRKAGKAGIIFANNSVLLPIQYDAVLEPVKLNYQYRTCIFKTGDLYGWMYFNTYKNNLEPAYLVEPFTPYLPYGLFTMPEPPTSSLPHFLLMRLTDSNGNIIGYTDRNKRQYWKD